MRKLEPGGLAEADAIPDMEAIEIHSRADQPPAPEATGEPQADAEAAGE
jgi:hypothetical protein